MIRRLVRWVDDRVGGASMLTHQLRKAFPSHWSFLLGEIALYSFIVLVLTGIYLTFFFVPSAAETVYHGSYVPLQGASMSSAYASVLDISFSVRAGLVMRQIHHWAALVFIAAIVFHLGRIFFTGAFRKPRELNWIIGLTMLVLAIANGFLGYSIVDDLLSGTGLRIANSVVLSVPLLGPALAFLIFGGEFPTSATISRFFSLHVLLVPVALAALIGLHLSIIWRQKHTQYPGPGHTETNVVGTRLWPAYAAKSAGLFFLVAGGLAALGGLMQINPVWLYGPFDNAAVTVPAQPDWYVGWLEGALRIFPSWQIHIFGHLIPELFWPAIVMPTVTFLLLYAWPFLEARITGDHDAHNLLDRPRERPARTAVGVAALTFYVVLFLAGADDVLTVTTGWPLRNWVWLLRASALLAPLAAGFGAYALLRSREATA